MARRHHQLLRKLVFGALLLTVLLLTFRGLRNDELAGLAGFGNYAGGAANSAACLIWSDWRASSPDRLKYDVFDAEKAELPVLGDARVLGRPDRCLAASSRFDQYQSSTVRSWDTVRWGAVQKRCASSSHKLPPSQLATDLLYDIWHQSPPTTKMTSPSEIPTSGSERTAIVLRTWDDYNYSESRRTWLRALIAETALHSGGRYEVFLLVNVKNDDIDLEDRETYQRALGEYVPDELQDMALLYNRKKLELWYPKISEHGAQDQMYQALQIFSHQFPHFAHIWQLEMDLRLTSHVQSTLDSMAEFALAQPRRNLWERNGRFYIPGLYNRSYTAFTEAVEADIGDSGVWGPVHTADFEPKGPKPPSHPQRDWGVNEEADLISLNPMIDPIGTDWIYEDRVYGFADGTATPRRAAFVSMTRSSRRLLRLVSEAQRERGQWLVSEATLETFALLHGLKAVTIPHPVAFAEHGMTLQQLDENLHHGPPHSKAGGWGISMSYTAHQGFMPGPWGQSTYWFASDDAPNQWHAYLEGRCMPPMLLHPVKDE